MTVLSRHSLRRRLASGTIALFFAIIVGMSVLSSMTVEQVHASKLVASSGVGMKLPQQKQMGIPIVMYHYVEIVSNPRDTLRQRLAVSPAILETQMQQLRDAGVTTLFLRDVPAMLSGSGSFPTKRVILTFDDGYEDFYQNAFPLLKKYQMKATLYVINDRIGKNDYLTEDQLKEIAASGLVEIGAHTVSHLDLSLLKPDKAEFQITESKRDLEKRLGVKVKTFAYPSGKYTASVVSLVKKAGYTAAVSTHTGTEQSASVLFTLYRVRLGNSVGKNMLRSLGVPNS